jgi:2-phosphosulfolactate phosphatase
MIIDVALTPAAFEFGQTDGRVVVIDVLRAACTLITALANGADRIIPVASVEEATITAYSTDAADRARNSGTGGSPPDHLKCGERGGQRIEGFNLGNSPQEYTAEAVQGKTLIFTTTNGSDALLKALGAADVIIGSFTNLSAVVSRIRALTMDTTFLCAGEQGNFSFEDAVCAGMFVDRLGKSGKSEMTDSAEAARILYHHFRDDLSSLMRKTFNGKVLVGLGFEADLDLCVELDVFDIVPVFSDGSLTGQ